MAELLWFVSPESTTAISGKWSVRTDASNLAITTHADYFLCTVIHNDCHSWQIHFWLKEIMSVFGKGWHQCNSKICGNSIGWQRYPITWPLWPVVVLNGIHAKQNGNWQALCIHDANGIGRIKTGYTRLSAKFTQSERTRLWLCLLLLNIHIKASINIATFNNVTLLRVTQYSERFYQEKLTFIPESTPRHSLHKFHI